MIPATKIVLNNRKYHYFPENGSSLPACFSLDRKQIDGQVYFQIYYSRWKRNINLFKLIIISLLNGYIPQIQIVKIEL